MKELYYNPLCYPASIKYINTMGQTKEVGGESGPGNLQYLGNLYTVINKYKDILVVLTARNEAYYPECIEEGNHERRPSYKRIPVEGEISLKAFINGGGYFDDPRFYPGDDRLKAGGLAWRL